MNLCVGGGRRVSHDGARTFIGSFPLKTYRCIETAHQELIHTEPEKGTPHNYSIRGASRIGVVGFRTVETSACVGAFRAVPTARPGVTLPEFSFDLSFETRNLDFIGYVAPW